jgi:hypothetical protein
VSRAALLGLAACVALGAGACRANEHRDHSPGAADHDDSDEAEQAEERETARPTFWRVQIAIEGQGRVADATGAFDCHRDAGDQGGSCGPKLVTFPELRPPVLMETPALGWRFVRWQPVVRGRDGAIHPRKLPPPDGPRYINGFGYSDTGELETVTAIFEPNGSAAVAR